jgi:hypothetical protein
MWSSAKSAGVSLPAFGIGLIRTRSVGRVVVLYDGRDGRLASQLPTAKTPATRAEIAVIHLNQRGNSRD